MEKLGLLFKQNFRARNKVTVKRLSIIIEEDSKNTDPTSDSKIVLSKM